MSAAKSPDKRHEMVKWLKKKVFFKRIDWLIDWSIESTRWFVWVDLIDWLIAWFDTCKPFAEVFFRGKSYLAQHTHSRFPHFRREPGKRHRINHKRKAIATAIPRVLRNSLTGQRIGHVSQVEVLDTGIVKIIGCGHWNDGEDHFDGIRDRFRFLGSFLGGLVRGAVANRRGPGGFTFLRCALPATTHGAPGRSGFRFCVIIPLFVGAAERMVRLIVIVRHGFWLRTSCHQSINQSINRTINESTIWLKKKLQGKCQDQVQRKNVGNEVFSKRN